MDLQTLQTQIDELRAKVEKLENGNMGYTGLEFIKHNIFETEKPANAGASPIYTSYSYGGVGSFDWSSMNQPNGIIVLNIGGKRYWIPYFTPN